jgi:transposase
MAIKHTQRSIYKQEKGSSGRKKASVIFPRKHLRISRQPNEHLKDNLCKSNDLVAYENPQVRNLLKVCSSLHRDENAAINILNLAKARDGQSQSHARGLVTSTLFGENLVEQVTRMSLESPWLKRRGVST